MAGAQVKDPVSMKFEGPDALLPPDGRAQAQDPVSMKFDASALSRGMMKPSLLNVMGYNPMSCARRDRLEDLSTAGAKFDVMLLAGTGCKDTLEQGTHKQLLDGKIWVHSGWKEGRFTNKSCGVAVGLRRSRFEERHIRWCKEAEGALKGRGLCLRLKAGSFDLMPLVAYFPPRPYAAGMMGPYKASDFITAEQ